MRFGFLERVLISVIIPVVNESDTIGQLVVYAGAHPDVEEVIVVDDGSIDDTPNRAREAGARVITSSFLGKGASLKDGLQAAASKYVVFLDAHLRKTSPDAICKLVEPLQDGEADVTLANCAGSLEPVSAMTAKPLLRAFFPEFNSLAHPLSCMWAARRSVLQKLPFENDHSVEISLLLDAAAAGRRLRQVHVPEAVVKEEDADLLAETAGQVAQAILTRAAAQSRLKPRYLANVADDERQAQEDLLHALEQAESPERVALFDMDGVLVRGGFVVELAYHLEKGAELSEILDDRELPDDERLEKIAALFTGVPRKTLEKVAHEMPLMPGAKETVVALRKAGYLVGVVADGFHVASEILRCRVFGDFSIAHIMKCQRGKATGRVSYAAMMVHGNGCSKHRYCKSNIIPHLTELLHVPPENILAVGNSENDLCMLRAAGQSVAFRAKRSAIREAADCVVEDALTDLLQSVETMNAAGAR